jgi:hypothetical protein
VRQFDWLAQAHQRRLVGSRQLISGSDDRALRLYMGMLADPRGNSEEPEEMAPENADGQAAGPPPKKKKRSVLEGLGGVLFR